MADQHDPQTTGPFSDPNKPRGAEQRTSGGHSSPVPNAEDATFSPSGQVPSNQVPADKSPSGQVPSNQVPSNRVPSNQVPATPFQQESNQDASNPYAAGPHAGDPQRTSVFGEGGKWLWFAGGMLLALIGVVCAALFNMKRPSDVRFEAVKYAVYGMLVGTVLELVLFSSTFGLDTLLGTAPASSSGSIF